MKKFLLNYPALFNIDGDYVHLNVYTAAASTDTGGSDYIEETKQYFKNKLLQYGIGTEVPIKSLLGHRSQASPQVRHISGQHIKEFTDFLIRHPDTFHVVDDNVILLGVENDQDVPQSERLHLPPASIDTKATQELLDYIADTIQSQGPQIVFSLFHAVTSKFPQEQWFRMFKTPNDLSTFLKLFSDCFHLQSDLVALLQKPKLSDTHIKHAQAAFTSQQQQQHQASQPKRGSNGMQREIVTRTISPMSNSNGIKGPGNKIGDFKLNEPVTGNHLGYNKLPATSEPNSGFDSLVTTDVKLENLCGNNCPIGAGKNPISPQNSLLGKFDRFRNKLIDFSTEIKFLNQKR